MFAPRGLLIIFFLYEVNCLSSTNSCCEPILSSWPTSCCTYPRCSSSSSSSLAANDYYYPTVSTTNPKGINSYQSSCSSFPLTKSTKCKNYKFCNKGRGKCGYGTKKLKTKCRRRFPNKCRNCASCLTLGDDLELLLGSSCYPCYPCSGYSPCDLTYSGYYPCYSACSYPCCFTSYCSY